MKDRGMITRTKPTSSGSGQESASTDSYPDNISKAADTTCTHTHTCNPPGPGSSIHTHTCFHTHTQLIRNETTNNNDISVAGRRKRPSGNREAVRKYREKKKAHAVYLEEEVRKLRVMNQQLGRKLKLRAVLEAEVIRLRSLLGDLNRRIDCELGLLPFQKQCSHGNTNNTTGCVGGSEKSWEKTCQSLLPVAADCQVSDRVSTGGDCSIIAPQAAFGLSRERS